NTNSIPVVSQVKSAVQAISGDQDGAKKTQEEFLRTGILVSQCYALVKAIEGDEEEAKKSQVRSSINPQLLQYIGLRLKKARMSQSTRPADRRCADSRTRQRFNTLRLWRQRRGRSSHVVCISNFSSARSSSFCPPHWTRWMR